MDLRARARNEELSGERGGREELGPAAVCTAAAAAHGSDAGDLAGGGGGVAALGGEAISAILFGLILVCFCSSEKLWPVTVRIILMMYGAYCGPLLAVKELWMISCHRNSKTWNGAAPGRIANITVFVEQ